MEPEYIYAADEDSLYSIESQNGEWYVGKDVDGSGIRTFPIKPKDPNKKYFITLSTGRQLMLLQQLREKTKMSRSELFFLLWEGKMK